MITIIDYGRGNLFSIGRALEHNGASFQITGDPEVVLKASKVILPGVGSFGDAMASLQAKSLAPAIHDIARSGVPILGICLGMQIFATQSEEFGVHQGLNLVSGTVSKLPDGPETRIPNVGWWPLEVCKKSAVLDGLPANPMMYFVHSFAMAPENEDDIAATIEVNGTHVAAMVEHDNIIGCQFHPEKSGPVGLKLIQRFLEI